MVTFVGLSFVFFICVSYLLVSCHDGDISGEKLGVFFFFPCFFNKRHFSTMIKTAAELCVSGFKEYFHYFSYE